MKYVRTKSGDIFESIQEVNFFGLTIYHKNELITYGSHEVEAVSEDLNDLFDEFVIIKKGKPELFVRHNDEVLKSCAFENFVKYKLPHSNSIEDIYGAIWTDYGLIYKARLTDVVNDGKTNWELL